MSAYGEDGPYKNYPGQDLAAAIHVRRHDVGRIEGYAAVTRCQYLVDAITAYTAFEGALAALFHRERTGEGQKVEVNMLDAITTIQMQELSVFTVGKKPQTRSVEPHAHSYIRAPYGVFKTKDSYITIAMANLKKLGELIGEPFFADLEDQTDSWTYRDEIYAMTRIKLEERTTQEWLDMFRPVDIWCGPVYGYEDVVNDPQIKHNGTFVEYDHPTEGRVKTPGFPIRFSKTPSTVDRGAPRVGEHTREILAAAGKSEPRSMPCWPAAR